MREGEPLAIRGPVAADDDHGGSVDRGREPIERVLGVDVGLDDDDTVALEGVRQVLDGVEPEPPGVSSGLISLDNNVIYRSMRRKSDATREMLLARAEEELGEKGFSGASLRSIAERAGATTGLIYTYFDSKDDLFEQLVAPAVSRLEAVLETEDVALAKAARRPGFNPQEWFTKNLRFLVGLIREHESAMRLLLLRAEGSRYAGYKETLVERGAARSARVFQRLPRSRAFAGQELSAFFVRNLAAYVIEAATDMLRQGSTPAETERYEAEISAFLFSGWRALVELES